MSKKSLIFIGVLLCFALLVGTVSAGTETLTVVYCEDQTTYPFSTTVSGNVGITVKDSNDNYYRYFPALESSSPTTARVNLSGTPSSYTWNPVQTLGDSGYILGGSDYNSYVNTGVIPSSTIRTDILFYVLKTDAGQLAGNYDYIYGSGSSTSNPYRLYLSKVNPAYYPLYVSNSAESSTKLVSTAIRSTSNVSFYGTTCVCNDDTKTISEGSNFSNNSIYVFGYNYDGVYKQPVLQMNLYSLKIYDNYNTLNVVRDYIPIKYGSTYALYDKCLSGDVIYGSSGSGSFSGGGTASDLTYTHTVVTSPTVTISTQPTTPVTINTSITATATGTAGAGGTLSYQWSVSKDSGSYTDISGQVSTSLTYTPSQVGSYVFRCTVTESGTSLTATATTNAVTVVTSPTVTISTQPTTPVTINTSITATATGTAGAGGTLSYQWSVSKDSGSYTDISGQVSTSLTYTPSQVGSYVFRCTVTESGTSLTATATTSAVTVISAPTVTISTQPTTPVTINTSITATATGTAGAGGTLSYQWSVSKDSGSYTDISGQVSTSLTYTPSQVGSYVFRCTVTESGTSLTATATTNAVTVQSSATGPTINSLTLTSTTPTTIGSTVRATVNVQGSSRLPSGYTEVEYIESNGLSYIDTGFKRSGDSVSYTVDFSPEEVYSINWCVVAGTTDAQNSGTGFGCMYGSFICLVPWMGNNEFGYPSVGNRESITLQFSGDTIYVTGDETSTITSDYLSPTSAWNDNTFTIGHRSENSYCKYYSVKFYRSGTLERDFVPCVRDSDNAVGMYDLVSNTFYANSGSAAYTAGSEIVSYPYTYQWAYSSNSGSTWTNIQSQTSTTLTTSFSAEGTYLLKCIVTSTVTSLSTDSYSVGKYATVSVVPTPVITSVSVTPYILDMSVSNSVHLTATIANPSGVYSMVWQQQKNGGSWTNTALTSSSGNVTITDSGTYYYRLKVTPVAGSIITSDTTHSVITGDPPTITITAPTNGQKFTTKGVNITVTATATGSGNTYSWTFGDSSATHGPSNTLNTWVKYSSSGDKTISVTATNQYGSSTASVTINYYDPTYRPMATATIAPVPTTAISNFTEVMDVSPGTYPSVKETVESIFAPIDEVMPTGFIFVLVFGVVFLMLWLITKNTTVPAIIGLIFGVFLLALFPASYYGPAMIILAISIAGGVYRVFRPPQ